MTGVEGHPDLPVYEAAECIFALLGHRGQEKALRFFTLYKSGAEEEN